MDRRGALSQIHAVELPVCGERPQPDRPQWVLNQGHAGKITRIVINTDASLLLTSGDDNSARVWNVTRASLVHALIGETHDEKLREYDLSATFLDDQGIVLSGNRVGLQTWAPGTLKDYFSEALKREWVDNVQSDGSGAALFTTRKPDGPPYLPTILTRQAGAATCRQPNFQWPTQITAAAVAAGGRFFAIGGGPDKSTNPVLGEIVVWDNRERVVLKRDDLAIGLPLSLQFVVDASRIGILTTAGLFEITIPTGILRRVLAGDFVQAMISENGLIVTLREEDERGIAELHDIATGESRLITPPGNGGEGGGHSPSAIAINRRGDHVALGFSDAAIGVWEISAGTFSSFWEAPRCGIDGELLISRHANGAVARDGQTVRYIDLHKGVQRVLEDVPRYEGFSISYDVGIMGEDWKDTTLTSISPDGELVASGVFWSGLISLWKTQTREKIRDIPFSTQGPFGLVFAETGQRLFVRRWADMDDDRIDVEDVLTGKVLSTRITKLPVIEHLSQILYIRPLPTGDGVLAGLYDGSVAYFYKYKRRHIPVIHQDDFISGLDVDQSGRGAAVGYRSPKHGNRVDLVDLVSGERKSILLDDHITSVQDLRLFPSGSYTAIAGVSSIGVFSTKTLQPVAALPTAGRVLDLQIAPNSRLMAARVEGTIVLYQVSNPERPRELLTYTNLPSGSPFVISPDGFFDTTELDNIQSFSWLMPDAPLVPLPAEIFMRDYYEPRLLPRLLAGEELPKLRPLGDLNPLQPGVKIVAVNQGRQPDLAEVTVEVSSVEGQLKRDGNVRTMRSDVFDLRLFRAGQLVGQEPELDIHMGTMLNNRAALTVRELEDWRAARRVKRVVGRVTLHDKTGKLRRKFTVKLPHGEAGKQIVFSSYAFNEDRVKSQTDKVTYTVPAYVGPVKRKAYVVAVGINAYEKPDWDLRFAATDAKRLQQALVTRLDRHEFEVVPVTLISARKQTECQAAVDNATKKSFQTVLELLAGHALTEEFKKHVPPGGENVEKAEPDDLVIISISSHGYTTKEGMFYVVPSDSGYTEGYGITPELRQKWISSDELSTWLRDVDAGDIIMVVDTCHSAATVEEPGFKPGPMGSRGLGQLAYDKGMRVLAASQANDVALESDDLKQGLLTYALVHDGLESKQAVVAGTQEITLDSWLEYGAERVPRLYEEVLKGTVRTFMMGSTGAKVDEQLSGGISTLKKPSSFQQPSLFNFQKRQSTIRLSNL